MKCSAMNILLTIRRQNQGTRAGVSEYAVSAFTLTDDKSREDSEGIRQGCLVKSTA
jgi:hypothetical protein